MTDGSSCFSAFLEEEPETLTSSEGRLLTFSVKTKLLVKPDLSAKPELSIKPKFSLEPEMLTKTKLSVKPVLFLFVGVCGTHVEFTIQYWIFFIKLLLNVIVPLKFKCRPLLFR